MSVAVWTRFVRGIQVTAGARFVVYSSALVVPRFPRMCSPAYKSTVRHVVMVLKETVWLVRVPKPLLNTT